MCSHVQSYSTHVLVQVTFFFTDCSNYTFCLHNAFSCSSYSTHALVQVTFVCTDCSKFMFSPHIVQIVLFLHTLFTLFCTLFSGVGGGEFCLFHFAIMLIFQMRFCDNDSVEHSHVTARTKLRGPWRLRSLIICLSLTTRKLTT